MFNYITSGGIRVVGCANPIDVVRIYEYKYNIGYMAYVLYKAEIGILKRVVIKRVNLVNFYGKVPMFNYVDTTNRVWFEQELLPLKEAKDIATAYLNRKISEITCT